MEPRDLRTEALLKFLGGQAFVRLSDKGLQYKGEIVEIAVEDGTLNIKFSWAARLEHEEWIAHDDLEYELRLWSDQRESQPLVWIFPHLVNSLVFNSIPEPSSVSVILYLSSSKWHLDRSEVVNHTSAS